MAERIFAIAAGFDGPDLSRWFARKASADQMRLMADLARHNNIVFDAVLGASFSRDYKPKPALYRDAAAAFGLATGETMMVEEFLRWA